MMSIEGIFSFIKVTLLSKNIFYILGGLIGVSFVIAFHEFGHLIFCKLFNIRAPNFSIGMGPKIFTKRIGTTDFSLSAIPLGGYVEIANEPESPSENLAQAQRIEQFMGDEEFFNQKPYWQKFLVMSGGILFNIIFAYFAFTLLYWLGMPNTPLAYPENAGTIIATVIGDTPAHAAGLKAQDKIISINGVSVTTGKEILELLKPLANQPAHFVIEREGNRMEMAVTLGGKQVGNTKVGMLGTFFEPMALPGISLPQAIKHGFERVNTIMYQTTLIFKYMWQAKSTEGLGGPIMIISQTVSHAERGIKVFLAFLAFISINLAILNVIPLPILDGGQILFATIEAIARRPLAPKVREYIHLVTWVMFMALFLWLSFKDIKLLKMLRSESKQTEQK